jgi:hypothetical protein
MIRAVFVVSALLLSASAYGEDDVVRPGLYSTVTESEWAVEINVRPDHVVTIELASWAPGEHAKPTVTRYNGTWQSQGPTIVMRVNNGKASYRVNAKLSFEDFGRDGSAPGLLPTSATGSLKLLKSQNLWLKSELEKIKW